MKRACSRCARFSNRKRSIYYPPWGRQLAPRGDAIDIDITGYTDTVPLRRGARFPDNHVLALARADAVAQHLAGCGIPTRNIAVHAAPASVTPYPNDTKENRTRNRTVEIRIAPR